MRVQDKFDTILNEFLKPFLKDNGFKTPAQNFYQDCGEFRKILQIQKSRWNSKSEIKFTINIGIFDKLISEKIDDNGKIKSPKPYDCILEKRIGNLLPENLDKWYEINLKTSIDNLKYELQSDLENYVIPYFNKFQSINDVISEYLNEKDPFIISKPLDLYYAIHLLQKGKNEKAKLILFQYLREWNDNIYWKEKISKLINEYKITMPNNQ